MGRRHSLRSVINTHTHFPICPNKSVFFSFFLVSFFSFRKKEEKKGGEMTY